MREYNYHRRPHGDPRVEKWLFGLKWAFFFLMGIAFSAYLVYLSVK